MNISSIPESNKSSFAKRLLLSTVADSRAYNKSKSEITKFLKTVLLDRSHSAVSGVYTSARIVSLIKSKDNSLSDIFKTFSILSDCLDTLVGSGDISYNMFVAESSYLESIKQICMIHGINFARDILVYNETRSIDNIDNLRKWVNVFESSKNDVDELL